MEKQTYTLTAPQQAFLKEIGSALAQWQDRQSMYLRGLFDTAGLDASLQWRISADGTTLEVVVRETEAK